MHRREIMGIFGDMIQYIIDMGASVMLPIVIAILSMIVGVKAGRQSAPDL